MIRCLSGILIRFFQISIVSLSAYTTDAWLRTTEVTQDGCHTVNESKTSD